MIEFRRVKILLFSDEPQLTFGASGLLSATGEFDVVTAPPDVSHLVPLVARSSPDMVLVDVTPAMTLTLFSGLKKAAPAARLVMWARSFSEQAMAQGHDHGIAGFISRTCDNAAFVDKVRSVARGGEVMDREGAGPKHATTIRLTPRESQLLAVLAQGLKNKQIASCLSISEGTVRIYLSRLFEKVGARDRFELALFAWQNAYCGQAAWDGRGGSGALKEEQLPGPMLRSLVLVTPAPRQAGREHARVVGF